MTGIAAPEEIVEVIKPVFDGLDREQFVVLYLNMKLHPIGVEIIAIGGSYERNVALSGAGGVDNSSLAVLLHHPDCRMICFLVVLKQTQCHLVHPFPQ